MGLNPDSRNRIFKRIVDYFFLNALEISSCPFLEDNHCLIYPERFFGCRAYGLWSLEYYENQALSNRMAKEELQRNWLRLGVNLPKTVIDFHQSYCLNVTPKKDASIDDVTLDHLADRVEMLSEQYTNWHELFAQTYYSDISFLSASLVFGLSQATHTKFTVVRDALITGNRQSLIRVLEGIPGFDELNSE